jgi:ribose-phosphate pyrophosphokinase
MYDKNLENPFATKYLRLNEILEDVTEEETIPFERFCFNGGENHIKIKGDVSLNVMIETQLKNANYIMELFMATDALRREGAACISLIAPYIPYGRQDRVMVPGEPLSIRVFAELLNSQGYDAVYTLDNHSSVTTALINNCVEINLSRIMLDLESTVIDVIRKETQADINLQIISPDAGSEKRTLSIARTLRLEILYASKVRNVQTGKITETKLAAANLTGVSCLIIDDICDGGRTFTELAKILREKCASFIYLYVSHGIFSNGVVDLFDYFDGIYTTNLFRKEVAFAEKTHTFGVLPLRKADII